MATLTTIANPFDPINSREIKEIAAGQPIYAAIDGFNCFYDVAVSINGQITYDYEYIIQDGDNIGFVAIPQGGRGKNPFATVAMIALAVAAPALAGAAMGSMVGAGVITGGMQYAAAGLFLQSAMTAGIMMLGGMMISSLLPANIPDMGPSSGGVGASTTYGWEGMANQSLEGVALPIIYGKTKIVPPIISQYVEIVDNKQYLNILYALNDGEISAVSDIMINDNPIAYYDNVTYDMRLGTNTQTLIPSFDNTRIDTSVGVKLTTSETIRTTSYNNVEALTIVVSAPGGLYYANDGGGLDSRTVDLEVKYRVFGSGTWTTIPSTSISGAETGTIKKTFTVNDLTPGKYDISVRRLVAETSAIRERTTVYFEAFTEVIYDDFIYPNTALLALRALATDQLNGSMPKVSCVVDRGFGLSNPALAAKNLLQVIGAQVNSAKFTEWETWCNTQNLKCNVVFDSEVNVRDALNIISLLGRANVVQIANEYLPIIDRAENLAVQRFLFTMGNIIKDSFEETYLPLADRTNVVEMSYFDENFDYEKQSIEVYQNGFDESVDTIRKTAITLYGCTSRAQAIRHARFLLNKNRYLTNTISFQADVDAIACTIGDIIDVSHDVPQWGYSGRVIDAFINDPTKWVFVDGVFVNGVFVDETTSTSLQVDRQITLQANVTYYLTVKFNSDDSRETVQVMSPTTITTDIIPMPAGFSKPIEDYMLYAIGEVNLETKLFRVVAITRSSEQRRKITAIEYIPEVYDDTSDNINVINVSALSSVTSLLATSHYKTDINGVSYNVVDLSWLGVGIGWNVYSRPVGGTTWKFEGYTTLPSFQIENVKAGAYEYKVGDQIVSVTAQTLPAAPSLTNVTVSPRYTGVQFNLTYDDTFAGFSHVEAWEAALAQTINDAVLVGTTTNKVYQRYGLQVTDSRNYWFRIVDVYGNTGAFYGPVVGSTSTNISNILLDLRAQQGTPQYLPSLSDILIAGYVGGVPSLGIDGNLFVDGTVTANKLAVMGVSTFTNDAGYTLTKTFSQTTMPTTGMHDGDIWFDTDDNNKQYRYNGTSWVSVQDGTIATKNKTYYQTTAPASGMTIGDIWFDTDDNYKQYRYSGAAWVNATQDAATAINTNTTTINGAKITTGSITASQIAADTITASQIAAGTITASEIAAASITGDRLAVNSAWVSGIIQSSDFTTIGGAGFRLKAEAASTNADPDIYGAYIRGGTIDGTTINASTINIRNLTLLNDNGNSIPPFFSVPVGMSVAGNTTTFNTGTYTYNSGNASNVRLVGATGSLMSFNELDTQTFEWQYLNWLPIYAVTTSFTGLTVSIKVGTTTLASRSTWTSNTTYSIGGFEFRLSYDSTKVYDYILFMNPIAYPNLDSTNTNPIVIEVTFTSASGTLMSRTKGMGLLVSNL